MRPPQGWEWLILLAIVLLLFGSKKLPDLARGLGRSLRILKEETTTPASTHPSTPGVGPQASSSTSAPTQPHPPGGPPPSQPGTAGSQSPL